MLNSATSGEKVNEKISRSQPKWPTEEMVHKWTIRTRKQAKAATSAPSGKHPKLPCQSKQLDQVEKEEEEEEKKVAHWLAHSLLIKRKLNHYCLTSLPFISSDWIGSKVHVRPHCYSLFKWSVMKRINSVGVFSTNWQKQVSDQAHRVVTLQPTLSLHMQMNSNKNRIRSA